MTTILVWYLVTVGNTRDVTYSPPLATLEECVRLQEARPAWYAISRQCVQVKVVKL